MVYSINRTSSPASGIAVADATLDTTFDIPLIGKGYPNYGDVQQESILHILENFSNVSPPPKPTPGQLWFDPVNSTLYIRTDFGIWKNLDENLDGSIINSHIAADAGISLSKLNHGIQAQVIINDSNGIPTYRTFSGDISVDSTGVVTIRPLAVGNAELQYGSVHSTNLSASIHIAKVTAATLEVSGSLIGTLTGNADSATQLEFNRLIAMSGAISSSSINFNGSADREFITSINNGVINSNHLSGSIHVDRLSSSSLDTTSVTADSISANSISSNLTGNADSADILSTPRKISLDGEISGSVFFDGSGDVVITTDFLNPFPPIPANAITQSELASSSVESQHLTSPLNITDLTTQALATSQLTASNFTGFGDLYGNASTSEKLKNPRVLSYSGDATGSGNFDGSVNLDIDLEVLESTKLRTPRKISLTGDLSGSVFFDGTQDVDINTAVLNDSHNHDIRYYEKAQSESRYLRKDTADTKTGLLTLNSGMKSLAEVDMSDQRLINLSWPTLDADAASVEWVNSRIASIDTEEHFNYTAPFGTSETAAKNLAVAAHGWNMDINDILIVQRRVDTSTSGVGNGAFYIRYNAIEAYKKLSSSYYARIWQVNQSNIGYGL